MPTVTGDVEDLGPLVSARVAKCLRRSGPCPIGLDERVSKVSALIDTGMGAAMIERRVVDELGLDIMDSICFGGGSFFGGSKRLPVACVRVALGDFPDAWMVPAGVVDSLGMLGVSLCLGQAFLAHVHFAQDGPARRFTLQWPGG